MIEHEILQGVERARDQLTALCARLENGNASPGPQENLSLLRDLQQSLEKLQSRYVLLCQILDRTNDSVFAKDRDGRYAMISSRGADMFGKTVAEVLGSDDRVLFQPADAERLKAIDLEVMNTGATRTSEGVFDIRGVPTTLLTCTSAWYDGQRTVRGVIGLTQDVTERRRREREVEAHHDRMRSMASGIVVDEERLRRLLAAQLHSGIGQDIALAKMKLSMLRKASSAELHDSLCGIEQLVEQADRTLRSITFQISPPSLHDLGLVAALQWLGEDMGRKHGLIVRIEDDDSPGVADEQVRVLLFRAVRELLTNAATHGSAREAGVRLARQDGLVCITVEDDGAGFDTADLDRGGYGLFGIREQLKFVDGEMQITSAPGCGTTVTLTAPTSIPVKRPTA